MIYTAPYVMFFLRADPLRGRVEGGWALEIETFLNPVKWHRAVRRVPFGAQKVKIPPPPSHPPLSHISTYTPMNSGQCSTLKPQNLLEINRKKTVTYIK